MKLSVITLVAFIFIALPLQGQFKSDVIHIDPAMMAADYSNLPDADLILATHQHSDHMDLKAIKHLILTGSL